MRVAFRHLPAIAAGALLSLAAPVTFAQSMSVDQARAMIDPFYSALNAAPGKDVAALISKATSSDWVSCGANDACSPRDKAIGSIAGFGKAIPDLKWEIKEVLVSGDRIIVRGEASGTPSGPFMGVAQAGKSFKVMSIDVHTINDGKIARSYHVEDWMGATRQLSSK